MKIEEVRKAYAEAVCDAAKVTSPLLREGLATVPREKFLGPGPWFVRGPQAGAAGFTEDADPARVYQNAAIAIDRERELFNGQPAQIAVWLDGLRLAPGQRVLHIGCGTGYYTALIAAMVGQDGRVFAIEVDAGLAARAKEALGGSPNVRVSHGDGRTDLPADIDVVLVHAGGTHVLPNGWTPPETARACSRRSPCPFRRCPRHCRRVSSCTHNGPATPGARASIPWSRSIHSWVCETTRRTARWDRR